jgi:hypothetical protein
MVTWPQARRDCRGCSILMSPEVVTMHLDFASEYARRSDEEIRLLIKDRHNLVDQAQEPLDVEVHKRRSNGFQPQVHEPEEPRVHVEEDDEEGNEVLVHSREILFPKICPRCLSPAAKSTVRISCAGGSWGFIPVLGLWRYLFLRYPVPFCRKCATSVRLRRWLTRAFLLIAVAASVYASEDARHPRLTFWLILIGSSVLGGLFWKLLNISKRWPPEGIEILSSWSSPNRRLQFANPAYERAFVAINGKVRSS